MRRDKGRLLLRLFNASPETATRRLTYDGPVSKIELVQLNGELLRTISATHDAAGRTVFPLTLPPLGVGTVRITP